MGEPKKRLQCAKCPWRKDVDPFDIPGGYGCELHENLRETIQDGTRSLAAAAGRGLAVMACHETPKGKELPCVGWLVNQLGPGNNLGLRLAAMSGRFGKFETVGEQHETFEDTLPKKRRKAVRRG